MGMFDTFHVRKENKVGIPVQEHLPLHHRGYQSYSLGCTLADIEIDENGKLFVDHHGRGSSGPNTEVNEIAKGIFSSPHVMIWADNSMGAGEEYSLVVVNNQIVRVKLYNELVYLADGYPMLDEKLHPVPKDHYLDLVASVGEDGKPVIEFIYSEYSAVVPHDHSVVQFQQLLSSKHTLPASAETKAKVRDMVRDAIAGTPPSPEIQEGIDNLHAALPGLVDEKGVIDVLAFSAKARRKVKAEEVLDAGPNPTKNDIWDFYQQAFKTGQKVHVDCKVDPEDQLKMNVTLFTDGTPAAPITVLGMDPGKNPLFNLNKFQNDVIVGLEKIISEEALKHPGLIPIFTESGVEVPGYLSQPKSSLVRGIDVNIEETYPKEPLRSGHEGLSQGTGIITYVDEGGVRRPDVLAMLRRRKAGKQLSPLFYSLSAALMKRKDFYLPVFNREDGGDKGHRYSKAIQQIVIRRKKEQ